MDYLEKIDRWAQIINQLEPEPDGRWAVLFSLLLQTLEQSYAAEVHMDNVERMILQWSSDNWLQAHLEALKDKEANND